MAKRKIGEIVILKPESKDAHGVSYELNSPFWVVSSLSEYYHEGEMRILITNMNGGRRDDTFTVGENEVATTYLLCDNLFTMRDDKTYDYYELVLFTGGEYKGSVGAITAKGDGDAWYYCVSIGKNGTAEEIMEAMESHSCYELDETKINAANIDDIESITRRKQIPWYERKQAEFRKSDLVTFKPYQTPCSVPQDSLWIIEDSEKGELQLRSFSDPQIRVTVSQNDVKYFGRAPVEWELDMDYWIKRAQED